MDLEARLQDSIYGCVTIWCERDAIRGWSEVSNIEISSQITHAHILHLLYSSLERLYEILKKILKNTSTHHTCHRGVGGTEVKNLTLSIVESIQEPLIVSIPWVFLFYFFGIFSINIAKFCQWSFPGTNVCRMLNAVTEPTSSCSVPLQSLHLLHSQK